MKKTIIIVFLFFVYFSLSAQTDFSGEGGFSLTSNISDGGFSSLLNPGNIFKLHDLSLSPYLIGKIESGDDTVSFSCWARLEESELSILRLSANVYLTDTLSLGIGRQSMTTGYGYGWNPTDFADPLKDLSDPAAELTGVDTVSLSDQIGDSLLLKFFAMIPESDTDFSQAKGGGEITINFSGFEWKLNGFYDYDSTEGDDKYVSGFGSAAMFDLFGAGLYGEAAFYKGSRNYFPEENSFAKRKTEWLFSGLIGIEYTFPSELYAVAEYFYNGEGFSKGERDMFKTELNNVTSNDVLTVLGSMYIPGYFARHYILLNLSWPLYAVSSNIDLAVLYSPDSQALMIMPGVSYDFSGSFTIKLGYIGMFTLNEDEFNEVSEMPVKNSITVKAVYNY